MTSHPEQEPMEARVERWVNAVIEVTIPLDVDPDAPDAEKQEAVVDAMETVGWPEDSVGHGRFEIVEERTP